MLVSHYCSRRSHRRHQRGTRQVPAAAAPGPGMPLPAEERAVPGPRCPLHFLSRPSRRRSDGRAALGGPGREVESARPPPALPPLSVAAAAPARAAGGRDAPALPGGEGTLPQCRGRSWQPEGGDAACACPALLPPREMNMSLPGRVSCSMLNCFVSAAFYSPSLLHGSGAVSQPRSPVRVPVEASSGSARGEGGSPSPRSRRAPEDTAVRPCCPGRTQGHSGARCRGLSSAGPGHCAGPRRLCALPGAGKSRCESSRASGSPAPPPWLRLCRTLQCCAELIGAPVLGTFYTFSKRGFPALTLPADPPSTPPGHSWPNGLRGLQEACEESRVLTPALPVAGMGLWPERMLSLCPPCAASEEGLKDTLKADGELRLPCSSSCCSLGFLCKLQSDDGRGSLLPGCHTSTHLPSLCALLGWCLSLGVSHWQEGP